MVYVRLADRSTRGVPAWMFDPAVCSTVRVAETPLIGCGALADLAALLARHEEQLMLGIGCPHQPERLPEPNRSQCITLLGKMLFCAVSPKPEPKDNIQP